MLPVVLDELNWHHPQPEVTVSGGWPWRRLVASCVIVAATSKELGHLNPSHPAAPRATGVASFLDETVRN